MLGPCWQQLFALNCLAPDHSAICPATLSKEAFQCSRHDVCVLRLPPGFPAVPHDLSHTPVVPHPLTEPDKWLSHIRLFVQPFSRAKGLRLTRTRAWGQPTGLRACR